MGVHIGWTTELCMKTKSMGRTHASEDTCRCIRQHQLPLFDSKPAAAPLADGPRQRRIRTGLQHAEVCISGDRQTQSNSRLRVEGRYLATSFLAGNDSVFASATVTWWMIRTGTGSPSVRAEQ